MGPIYYFYLSSDSGLSSRRVYPNYKDDLAKEYELETNQMFYRAKLSGKLTFMNDEFDLIKNGIFDSTFKLQIYISYNVGAIAELYYTGKFMKTDCTFNDYDRLCEVQPDTLDEYNDVLAGLEKEYNLITLAPSIERLLLQKRPLIQIYIPGDSVISCFLGGVNWEQDANATTDINTIENTYKFALCNYLKEINITGSLIFGVNDLYTGRLVKSETSLVLNFAGELTAKNNTAYKMVVSISYVKLTNNTQLFYNIVRISDNVVIYRYSDDYSGQPVESEDFVMTGQNGVTGNVNAEMTTYRIYARYLLDVDTIQGLTTSDLPIDDIVDYNRGYKKVIGYAIDVAYISMNFSDTPKEWGITDDGRYYVPPYDIFGNKFYPIARSTWRYASIWFRYAFGDEFLEKEGRKTYELRDNFPVSSCINVLLKQFAPDITHEATADYSQFLYNNTNPLTGQIFKLLVSQKTNVINGEYQKPAQKAPATLQQFMFMLRDCYKCYWFIENGKLRIEHVLWFKNGGSYSGTGIVGLDLTETSVIRNGKKWAFNTSEYSFDKVDLAERYQFSWMDEVTEPFKGYPIQVISNYVTKGKVEDITISNFTSDIDMMLLNPNNMSDDGFALFAAIHADALTDYYPGITEVTGTNGHTTPNIKIRDQCKGRNAILRFTPFSSSGTDTGQVLFYKSGIVVSTQSSFVANNSAQTLNISIPVDCDEIGFNVVGSVTIRISKLEVPDQNELPIIERTIDGVVLYLQNGYLAFINLQPNFWVYDLPAQRVMMNNELFYALGIERKKKQTLTFPVLEDINPIHLVKTYLGDGQIDKMSINLHSRTSKTTLKYDTE